MILRSMNMKGFGRKRQWPAPAFTWVDSRQTWKPVIGVVARITVEYWQSVVVEPICSMDGIESDDVVG
jgi:hypothetical protein